MLPWIANSAALNVFVMCVEGPQGYLHAKSVKDKLFSAMEYMFVICKF